MKFTTFIISVMLVSAAFAQVDDEVILDKPLAGGEAVSTETIVPDVVVPVGTASTAAPREQSITSEPINVDGVLVEKKRVVDPELEGIRNEIRKQKTELVLNKEKVKHYKALTKSVEQLSETTVEYLEEKKAAQAEIAEYNHKVKCLNEETPSKDCEKYSRRR